MTPTTQPSQPTPKRDELAEAMEARGYIDVPEATRRWKVSRPTLYSWHQRGLIGGDRVGRRLFLLLDERLRALLGPLLKPAADVFTPPGPRTDLLTPPTTPRRRKR